MRTAPDDSRAALRRAAYWLLIAVAIGGMAGRILTVASRDGKTPFLSANDRSRWCAIRSLGDEGTHVIDNVIIRNPQAKTHKEKFDLRWYSIDMVRHKGHDGQEHFYSSKPTLLNTILAGEYWLIKQAIGGGLEDQTFYVARLMLLITNGLPLLLYFVLLARLLERYGTTDWGRLFTMTAAVFGTFLTTFAITLNNHLIAAVSVLVAVYAALPILAGEEKRQRYHFAAGCGAAFAAANELPALSFLVLLGAGLFWKSPWRTLIGFVPPAAVIAAAAIGTNYLAHGSWKTPYAHRQDGAVLVHLPKGLDTEMSKGRVPSALRTKLAEVDIDISPTAEITTTEPNQRWVLWDADGSDRLAIVRHGDELQVRAWDNWYEYAESYWTPERKRGVDQGEPDRLAYTAHLLVGHHGIFTLTPIWLMSAAGVVMLLAKPVGNALRGVPRAQGSRHAPCTVREMPATQFSAADPPSELTADGTRSVPATFVALAAMTAVLTLVCLAFYISRPLADRNYGGVTCGLRWLFWFIPLWLLCLLPIADVAALRRSWRIGAIGLLVVSATSAAYASLNPWSHPWLYAYWEYLGWIDGA